MGIYFFKDSPMKGFKEAFKALNQRPIAYYPVYAKVMGGVSGGVFLSQILYWYSRTDQDEFYKTDKELRRETGLSIREMRYAKARIKELDFVKTVVKGVPPRTYWRIDFEKLIGVLSNLNDGVNFNLNDGVQIDCNNGVSTDCNDGVPTITEITTETTTKTKTESKEDPPNGGISQQVFEIVSYLNTEIGSHYLPKTPKTVKLIQTRFKEGFTVDDFKTVIHKKYLEWKGTEMQEWLRPETLFGTKFEGYLNQKIGGKKLHESHTEQQARILRERHGSTAKDILASYGIVLEDDREGFSELPPGSA